MRVYFKKFPGYALTIQVVNTPPAHLTVKALIFITGTGGMAYAYWAEVLYRWDEEDVIEGQYGDVLF